MNDRAAAPHRPGAGFWVAVAVGWAIVAFAVRGLLGEPAWAGNPGGFARVFLGGAILHDLVFVPAVGLVGVVVARLVPGRVRAPVQAGLIASGVVVAFAWPYVRGYGSTGANPSVLPLDYGTNLAIVLGLIWTAVAVALALRLLAPGSLGPHSPGSSPAGPARPPNPE